MAVERCKTEELLSRARAGDSSAVDQLFAAHRGRLKRMVAVRLDSRLAARLDASDIVQEALTEAARQLPGYLAQPSFPFYPGYAELPGSEPSSHTAATFSRKSAPSIANTPGNPICRTSRRCS